LAAAGFSLASGSESGAAAPAEGASSSLGAPSGDLAGPEPQASTKNAAKVSQRDMVGAIIPEVGRDMAFIVTDGAPRNPG
jgi:hypothetical protein